MCSGQLDIEDEKEESEFTRLLSVAQNPKVHVAFIYLLLVL